VGVVLAVDGLNVVSGDRERFSHRPGRMYVLDPWDATDVRGWRTSLDEVRRFTFVDERGSYASRTGQANEKMGWIEAAVYRERRPPEVTLVTPPRRQGDARGTAGEEAARPGSPAAAPTAEAEAKGAGAARDRAREEGFPGTGWGERRVDRAVVVAFEPETHPTERVTLRYEYRSALVALGVLPPRPHRDRLRERDSAAGFARPPADDAW
jgi:hypothetical protein